jgi:RNA polymerase sigma factor (sigma-70 family)
MSDMDAEIARRAQAGDPLAAPMLVSMLGDRLLGFAHSQAPTLSDADREQIVELAIEAGVRAIKTFDSTRGTLYSWFRQQVRYQTRQWFRTHPPMAELTDVPAVAPDGSDTSWLEDPSIRAALRKCISQLSADDQDILAIRSAEGLAFQEIALRMNIKEATARQRHKRALDRLRRFAMANETLATTFARAKEGSTT